MRWGTVIATFGLISIGFLTLRLGSEPYLSKPSLESDDRASQAAQNKAFSHEAIVEEEHQPLAATARLLDGSDTAVIAAANDLAPQLVEWLTPEDQVRRWVALVDRVADGNVPQTNRPLEYPITPLVVEHHDKKMLLDSTDYRRADWLVNVITDISPLRLAHYYRAWRPVLDAALVELTGKKGFDQRLRRAIQQVLSVQPLPVPPELVYRENYFRYVDPALEHANNVHKLMWRLRPDNARRLQHYLQELEQQLSSTEPQSPNVEAARPS